MGILFPARLQIFLVAGPSVKPIEASSYSVAFVALFKELKQPQGKADQSKHLIDEFKNVTSIQCGSWTPRKFCFFGGVQWSFFMAKVKVNFALEQATKTQKGNRSTALLFL